MPKAQALADKLNITFDTNADFILLLDHEHLWLKSTNNNINPICVDFQSNKNLHRAKYGGGIKQDIARAVGIKPNYRPTIIDATAGLAKDSFVLASLGCQVLMLERSPILAALIEDGLERALETNEVKLESIQRLKLLQVDSIEYLSHMDNETLTDIIYPDVIYLDPMFPDRTKTALVKKEMQICQELIGKDLDAEQLLQAAVTCALKRVVVKRPRLAEAIGNHQPDITINGKTCRYDIYLRNNNT